MNWLAISKSEWRLRIRLPVHKGLVANYPIGWPAIRISGSLFILHSNLNWPPIGFIASYRVALWPEFSCFHAFSCRGSSTHSYSSLGWCLQCSARSDTWKRRCSKADSVPHRYLVAQSSSSHLSLTIASLVQHETVKFHHSRHTICRFVARRSRRRSRQDCRPLGSMPSNCCG